MVLYYIEYSLNGIERNKNFDNGQNFVNWLESLEEVLDTPVDFECEIEIGKEE